MPGVGVGLTPRARKEQQRQDRLEKMRKQVKDGTLVVRKATKTERKERRVQFKIEPKKPTKRSE